MALMGFREANRVMWRGCRPAHDGTQILESSNAINDTVIVHTVNDGMTLFLTSAILDVEVIAAGNIGAWIRDDGDAFVWYLFRADIVAAQTPPITTASFWPPIEIPEKYDIVVFSGALLLKARLGIHGWEE